MILGLILASGALALIAWLVFNLSVYALPFFVGASAASLAHRTGAGLVGSAIAGLIAGAVTFGIGQAAFGVARSALARAIVAAIFAIPAAVAGYYSTLGIVALCVSGEGCGRRSRSSAASSLDRSPSGVWRRSLRSGKPSRVGQPTLSLFSACRGA